MTGMLVKRTLRAAVQGLLRWASVQRIRGALGQVGCLVVPVIILLTVGYFCFRWYSLEMPRTTQYVFIKHRICDYLQEKGTARPMNDVVKESVRDVREDGKLIIKNPEGHLLDVYGNRLIITLDRQHGAIEAEIRSVGRDGRARTHDDIVYRFHVETGVGDTPKLRLPSGTEQDVPSADGG